MNQKKMAKTGHQYLCAKKMVLKKYRKQRFGVRKKCLPSLQHVLDPETVNTKFKLQRQQVSRMQSHETFSSSTRMEDETFTLSQLVTSSLSHTNVCSEFPISEIGSELSGNRGNGNSPFNSSNSCGSPESAVIQNSYLQRCPKQGQGSGTEGPKFNNMNDCDKCILHPEQNNNLGLASGCGCPTRNDGTPVRDIEESIIDVVSLDEEESVVDEEDSVSQDNINHVSNAFDPEECLDKRKPLSVDVTMAEQLSSVPSPCKVNQRSSSRSSVSPINWQQQFMSFLSTTPEPTSVQDAPMHLSSHKSPSHSSRKKRSRKVRISMCPCCVGTSPHSIHGKRQKHHSGHSRKHSLSKEHKHFIRDMVQLVSLRNKVVTLFCSIFPQCQDFIRAMNPDSEKVDLLIDQVVDILQTPEPFDIAHLEDEKDDVKSVATYSDSGTDPVDLSEYPSLEKPDEFFFADKDSDDMPVLDDYSADDKTQDEGESVSKGPSYSEDFLAFLGKTRNNQQQKCTLDLGANSILLESDPPKSLEKSDSSDYGLKNCSSAFSEGDSGILMIKDHDVRDGGYCCPELLNQQGPNTDLGDICNSKCNTNHKTGPSVLLRQTSERKTPELSNVKDKFQGSFQEFLNSNRNEDSDDSNESDHDIHDFSCEELEENENKLTSFTSINSHQPIHLPAYSDISEASRLSSSSPFDWTGGADSPLFGKPESKYSFLHKAESQASQPDSKPCDNDLPLGDADGAASGAATLSGTDCQQDLSLPCVQSETAKGQTKTIKIYESYVETCRKPKICLKALKHRLNALLTWMLPNANLGGVYFKSFDNLEYLLDVLIYSNTVTDDTDSHVKDIL
ncbi:uncharacterized protein LOC110456014 [Mizuhopecten yessoensis]|uniref:Uncharacterized protein n=1 Tax=Mizuhopecten yessoensis TaxID=6573 RepID=A0A210QBU9_MIZYE|nr:uncharacterized protein LOC110456014 [Mizuhopecten yessoensis]OWF46207.1 hypothetical protein KP79_PYT08133 [Mizuhopecten yessoensis]